MLTDIGGAHCFIYLIRHGVDDKFKVGRTRDLDRRLQTLQTGSPTLLTVFAAIETSQAVEGEKYLLHRLRRFRLIRDNFAMTEEQAHEVIEDLQRFLAEAPRRHRLSELAVSNSTDDVLPATAEALEWRRQLLDVLGEMEQLEALLDELRDRKQRLEICIKLAIGTARAIEGVATWETVDGRRRFDPDWVRSDDPELYERYLTYVARFDTGRFRKDMPSEYASHQRRKRMRVFSLLSD